MIINRIPRILLINERMFVLFAHETGFFGRTEKIAAHEFVERMNSNLEFNLIRNHNGQIHWVESI